jgi:hypothetical protein
MALHMIKLCVGCETVEELLDWHRGEIGAGGPWTLHTRQTPKRAAELVGAGSLYRVFKGVILCRQTIVAVDTVGEGAGRRCQVTLDHQVVRVAPTPRRPFQGWRYLEPKDAPPDLFNDDVGDVPADLAKRLREAGVW